MDRDTQAIMRAAERVGAKDVTPQVAAEFARVLRESLGLKEDGHLRLRDDLPDGDGVVSGRKTNGKIYKSITEYLCLPKLR